MGRAGDGGSIARGSRQPAAGSRTDGPTGQLTLCADDNYEGHQESRSSYDDDFGNDSCAGCDIGPGGNFEDDASSVVNRTGDWWVLFEDDDQNGAQRCLKPRSHDGDLGSGGQLEDKVSSVKRYTTSRPSFCSDEEVFGVDN